MEETQTTAREVNSDYRGWVTQESPLTNAETLRQYEVHIRFLTGRGCIVNVGCKEIAFEDVSKAMEALNAYVLNPKEEAKKWNAIFNK